MSKTTKCGECGQRKPSGNFRFLEGTNNPYSSAKKSRICLECQEKNQKVPVLKIRGYANRDIVLRRMGFASYADYLASPIWLKIRLRVLKKDGFRCVACGGRATQVHHNLYRRQELCGQSIKGMRSLCAECHRQVEFSDGRKVGLTEAANRCFAMEGKP